jgi:acetamidase/formamidase
MSSHHYVAANNASVHWGYFSKSIQPLVVVRSGDFATIETLTHHGGDDYDLLIKGDPGAESVYHWTPTQKNVRRRGAGPTSGVLKRGSGEGLGVHLLTGPVYVEDADPGDVLEVRILDVCPRPCGNPAYRGRTFGVNAAASWGFRYGDLIEQPAPREVITVFDFDTTGRENWVKAVHSYTWTTQTDPDGFVHATIDYPGVVVDHSTVRKKRGVLEGVRIPVRPHFGTMGLAPSEADYVSSIPPSYTGGNIDNWRIGKSATMYYPVAVSGALFSVGDPHAAQGDSELCGTAIETSLTGLFRFILHKQHALEETILEGLDYPLLETAEEWIIHGFSFPNYLAALGPDAQLTVASHASIDNAMRDAFRKTRRFLMTTQALTEDEAITLMSVGIDFGITQVVDGNWGVHAIVKKVLFAGRSASMSGDR